MNKEIALKHLKNDLYQSEKRMVTKTRRQRTLEEYFKIRARAFRHVFCYARFCYARSILLRPPVSATPARFGYARSILLRPFDSATPVRRWATQAPCFSSDFRYSIATYLTARDAFFTSSAFIEFAALRNLFFGPFACSMADSVCARPRFSVFIPTH
jgi:hypothetical protein